MKNQRHHAIIDIIVKNKIETQSELAEHLNRYGYHVTQATVSRDIKDLGLTKSPTSAGQYIYTLPAESPELKNNAKTTVLKESFIHMDIAANLIVLKTLPGMAQAAGFVIDATEEKDKLGSIAGDDTVMIVCRNELAAKRLYELLSEMVR